MKASHETSSSVYEGFHPDCWPCVTGGDDWALAALPLRADDVRPADLGELIDKADKVVVLESPRKDAKVLFESAARSDLDALKAALKVERPERPCTACATARRPSASTPRERRSVRSRTTTPRLSATASGRATPRFRMPKRCSSGSMIGRSPGRGRSSSWD